MLNLGCGGRYRADWVNVNFPSTGPGVIAANLIEGIPFPDASFDVVYHSHLLEHIPKPLAWGFLKECHRVLKPGGIIRVVVPDLEAMTRSYLEALEKARAGKKGWDYNYDWMMLEMYDQVVRDQSGGEMARYLLGASIPNEEYVIGRCGTEVRNMIVAGRRSRSGAPVATQSTVSGVRKLFDVIPVHSFIKQIYGMFRKSGGWKEKLVQQLLGSEYEVLQAGRFRRGGEIHKWMYDSYSLGRLLLTCGFKSVAVRSATESCISHWSSQNLDTEPDGSVYKPDSLFMEALA
ncbi:MAG: methyltransferase domain-containing protein [Nitrospira sp. LK70]|nr:methyltransferase domain-containing protein [Nitrospira sp. LK70]